MLKYLLVASLFAAQPVSLPPHDASDDAYERARSDDRFVMRRIGYDSDGLRVFAFIYGPTADGPFPVVIFNRGSFVRDDVAEDMLPMAHRFAQAGYLVVAPAYRGSEGGEGRDEMGGADLADLFNLLPVLREMPGADVGRLFLLGESRGGMMVLQAIRDGFPARAAATYGAFTDLDKLAADPGFARVAEAIWPDFAERKEEIVTRRSAMRWVDRLDVPLLVMHGGEDTTIAVSHSLDLAERLAAEGKCFDLWVAGGAGHVLSPREPERDRRAIEWFRAIENGGACTAG